MIAWGVRFLVMRWRWQMIVGLVVFMLGQWLQTKEVKLISYHISGYEAKYYSINHLRPMPQASKSTHFQ